MIYSLIYIHRMTTLGTGKLQKGWFALGSGKGDSIQYRIWLWKMPDMKWDKAQAFLYNVGHSSNTSTYDSVLVGFTLAKYARFLLS